MNILLLTHRLPYAPNRGDRIRAFHLLHQLARHHHVRLLSLAHDADEASMAPALAGVVAETRVLRVPAKTNLLRGASRLLSQRPLTHSLLSSPEAVPTLRAMVDQVRPDLVVCYCSGIAQYAFDSPLRNLPLLVDMVDADSAKWRAMAASRRPPMRWVYAREARTLAAFERRLITTAACTLVVHDRERQELLALAPSAHVRTVPNGIDLEAFAPREAPAASNRVVFTGVMDYGPNIDAMMWLVREIWPIVRQARPEARLQIVGAKPAPAVLALAGPDIEVTGSVPDTRPYLWAGAVAVAPLLIARGVQNKVLEAVAAGLPAVVTPVVADGLPQDVMAAVDVAGTPDTIARSLLERLAMTPDARRTRATAADLSAISWAARFHDLPALVDAAAASGRRG